MIIEIYEKETDELYNIHFAVGLVYYNEGELVVVAKGGLTLGYYDADYFYYKEAKNAKNN